MDIEGQEEKINISSTKTARNRERVVKELEVKCAELGLKVIYDDLRSEGGVCRVHNRFMVIINRRCSAATKVKILQQAIQRVKNLVLTPPELNPQEEPKSAINSARVQGKTT